MEADFSKKSFVEAKLSSEADNGDLSKDDGMGGS